MKYERQKRLIERLLQKTRAGELDWQKSAGSDQYQFSFSKYTVQISIVGFGNKSAYRIEIIDAYGVATDSFNDFDLKQDGEHSHNTWHDIMREIFETARRKVFRADEALDGILAEMSR